MSVTKKITVCIICFTFYFCCAVFLGENPSYITTDGDVLKTKTVIVDAGHGGFDGGAVADDGTPEKDINLAISLKLSKMLKLHGYNVILTRETDTGTETDQNESIAKRKKSDMGERLRVIEENPDAVFISIHLNKFTSSAAKGAQVFYSPNNPLSRTLGQSVQNTVKTLLQPENTRTVKKGTRATYLLYRAGIPAIIVECGFLSNKNELALLKNEEYQSKMAFAVLCGILNYGS